ncbi:MAG: DUF4416 family protein [Sphaerochaetaceae bacterium]
MGIFKEFSKVCLVIGVLSTLKEEGEVISLLEKEIGKISKISDKYEFSFTDYYDEEMGKRPDRWFIVFEELIDPQRLAEIKIQTNQIEEKFALDGKRKVNLDPGILSLGNFILATTKNRSHRIPLRNGIYGELTLIFKDKKFNALDWTYADYRSEKFEELFKTFREEYKQKLKSSN